jgi:hypothetical protein
MKGLLMYLFIWTAGYFYSSDGSAAKPDQPSSSMNQGVIKQDPPKLLFIDVHHMGPGKVSFEDLARAHAKDLTVEKKFGVRFLKCWLDEANGTIYCLSSAADSQRIRQTHAAAHGFLPDQIFQVSEGSYALLNRGKDFYLDVHELGAGKVTAKDVEAAHQKDLIAEKKYNVNLINYWVDEKQGIVMCLSQSPDSSALIHTHKDAHGLLPAYIVKVKPVQ